MTDDELLAGNEPTLNGVKLSQIYAEQMAHRLAANCFDIFEAAKAIAVQLGFDKSTEEELRDDMSQAAHEGKLTVRSPRGHDQYAPTRPPSTTYGFDCLVTPDDVNEWATKRRLSWRWRVQAPAQSPAMPAPVAMVALVEPAKAGPGWNLKTSIKRAPGYRWPLYQFLKAAYIAGQPCPKARDVLDAWTLKPPPDVQAMPDGVKYNNGLGNSKEADLKAIQQAIKYLLN